MEDVFSVKHFWVKGERYGSINITLDILKMAVGAKTLC